ncbi:MAG: 16S rRNA (guanine(966)-N(2))-methyltransferase RsmD [Verrucomicrobiaceae bacterium]|nr:16S rRNA (guanine(966)-N(2))-methyltransferase RsmD [Verrucomicrobiaceae bacterium]
MRLISGTAGGIPIEVPKTVTRPTQDRVRQAVFSMLAEIIGGARVLDLFAGSGAFGLECLSRGAASALLVEQDRRACDVIRRNAQKTRLAAATVRNADVFRALEHLQQEGQLFDLAFADPPYAHHSGDIDLIAQLLAHESLARLFPAGAHLVLECLATRKAVPFDPGSWEQLADRTYGSTRITVLRRR